MWKKKNSIYKHIKVYNDELSLVIFGKSIYICRNTQSVDRFDLGYDYELFNVESGDSLEKCNFGVEVLMTVFN